jgi:hypothetical protein
MNEEEKKALKVINTRTKRLLDEFKIEKEDMSDEPKIAYLMQEIRANKTILNLIEKLQKENEELKQDRNNNYQMIALAQNEVLGYMQGYEDGKKLKRSAVACVVENQQYYIIKKEIEHYKEYIEKLQKENEELKNKLLDTLEGQKVIKEETPQYIKENFIPVQKIKDKIEKLNDESHAEELEDIMIGKNYTITELVQYVLQELIEESEEK